MTIRPLPVASMMLGALAGAASICAAQTLEWGVKGGINTTSVAGVPDYYDWVLCCHPLIPDARVDAGARAGVTAGGFVALPIGGAFALQGEMLFSNRRHAVDLQPYEDLQLTMTRTYIEVGGLLRAEMAVGSGNRAYVAGGPVFGFRIGEGAESNDASVRRGDPEQDIYVVQIAPYSAPELLRTSQASIAIAGGWVYRRFLVEVRFTQGLQSVFRDQEGLIAGFVKVGGHEPTLQRIVPEFAPFLESAKNRDVAVLAGVRF